MALPLIGFGTMEPIDKDPPQTADVLEVAVKDALNTGYRHFDTAEMYLSTQHVKNALSSFSYRSQLFITSKLKGLPSEDYNVVKQRTSNLLANLGLQKLDLLLIHWPGPADLDLSGSPEAIAEKATFEYFSKNIGAAWNNFLKLREDGLVSHIGVSNFYKQHIEELLKHVEKPEDAPFANEIYIDLFHQEIEYVNYLQSKAIHVIAYRPITFLPVCDFMEDLLEPLNALREKSGANSNQELVLAWLMKRGIHVIPKSTSKERIEANFAATSLVNNIDLADFSQFDGNEMVDMYGGQDEYALAFKNT